MMRALDTRYPISIRNESTGGSGRTSSRFPIRCLRVALMNPRNSTPLPAYDACYTIECGFHCATDCLPPIQITIVRSSSARPRDRVRQRIRHHVRLVIFQIHLRFYIRIIIGIIRVRKHDVSLSSSGIRIGSFRDEIDFGNGHFQKWDSRGTINMKYRYRYYIHLKFFHLYVYIQLYIHTLVCIFEMKI